MKLILEKNDGSKIVVENKAIEDALNKLYGLLSSPHPKMGKISDWTDGTIDRICDILEGKGENWLRMSTDYRKHTREAKY